MTKEELKKKIVEVVNQWHMFQNRDMNGHTIWLTSDSEKLAGALIEAGLGDVSEWKHRAKRAEKTMIRLAKKYVDAAKINMIKDVNGKIYFAERQACVTYVATMEMLESEKEFQLDTDSNYLDTDFNIVENSETVEEDPEYLPPIR